MGHLNPQTVDSIKKQDGLTIPTGKLEETGLDTIKNEINRNPSKNEKKGSEEIKFAPISRRRTLTNTPFRKPEWQPRFQSKTDTSQNIEKFWNTVKIKENKDVLNRISMNFTENHVSDSVNELSFSSSLSAGDINNSINDLICESVNEALNKSRDIYKKADQEVEDLLSERNSDITVEMNDEAKKGVKSEKSEKFEKNEKELGLIPFEFTVLDENL